MITIFTKNHLEDKPTEDDLGQILDALERVFTAFQKENCYT
jgi:hypothetical protein